MAFKNILLGSTVLAAISISGVFAQTGASSDTGSVLDVIVVTAQRKVQNIQDVPIAISNFSPKDMEARQVQETLDLLQFVPNAIAQNNTGPGAANAYFIRGLGSTQSLATFDSPVGTYVDDLFVGRQAANNFALFDLERVEVLRGPQGTLFGRNTTGGAVRLILRKPTEQMDGYVTAGYGSFERKSISASINVPLSDRVFARVSGYYLDDNGFVDNVATGETGLNDETNLGIRGALRFEASEIFTWDGAIDYINNDHANEINFLVDGDRVAFTGIPRDGSTLINPITSQSLFSEELTGRGLGSEAETFSASSKFSIELSEILDLEVISTFLRTEQYLLVDVFSGGVGTAGTDFPALQTRLPEPVRGSFRRPTGGFVFGQLGNHDQFTQEIKLNGGVGDNIDYTAGFYYYHEDSQTQLGQVFTLSSGFPLTLANNSFDNTTKAWALYGQADIKLSDPWTFTIGARFTSEDRDIAFEDNIPAGAMSDHTTEAFVAAGLPAELSASLFTPRFAISYQVMDDLMLFASATRGFKSGGWNASATDIREALPFDAEKVWSYEGGLRSEFLDNRIRINATAFLLDVSDFQVLSGLQRANGTFAFLTRSFADLRNVGLEIDVVAAVTDKLTAFGALGFQDAENRFDPHAPDFDEFGVQSIAAQQRNCLAGVAASCGAGIVTADGSIADPVRTPRTSGNLGLSYRQPVSTLDGFATLNFTLRYFEDHPRTTTGAAFSFTGNQTLFNASITYESDASGITVDAGCKNCSDDAYIISTVGPLGWINDPRTWFINLRYEFGAR